MPTARDVPAQVLIERVAEKLRGMEEIKPPEWARWAKTGVNRQRPPLREDWWYVRAASVLRNLYLRGRPSGVERMRVRYGGSQDRGVRPNRFRRASGHVLRLILQQLEAAGLVMKTRAGRKISPRGASLLDGTAAELIREMGLEPGRVRVP